MSNMVNNVMPEINGNTLHSSLFAIAFTPFFVTVYVLLSMTITSPATASMSRINSFHAVRFLIVKGLLIFPVAVIIIFAGVGWFPLVSHSIIL